MLQTKEESQWLETKSKLLPRNRFLNLVQKGMCNMELKEWENWERYKFYFLFPSVPPFKIVILDEADSMTKDAQSALRRTMEKQGKSTRFCLVCNYISRIIDPITSRCAKFRFKSLSNDAIRTRLEMVCTEEKLQVKDDESMEALIESSEGDMRKAITTLQSCSRLNKVISKREIYEVRILIYLNFFFGISMSFSRELA